MCSFLVLSDLVTPHVYIEILVSRSEYSDPYVVVTPRNDFIQFRSIRIVFLVCIYKENLRVYS